MSKKMNFTFTVVFIVLSALSLAFGGGEAEAAEGKMYTFYLFEVSFGHTYFIGHIHGAQEAAAKYPNVNLVVLDERKNLFPFVWVAIPCVQTTGFCAFSPGDG